MRDFLEWVGVTLGLFVAMAFAAVCVLITLSPFLLMLACAYWLVEHAR